MPSADAWTCSECGDPVRRCSECLHDHHWYDHVGPQEHMCEWCLRSDYRNDPGGPGPISSGTPVPDQPVAVRDPHDPEAADRRSRPRGPSGGLAAVSGRRVLLLLLVLVVVLVAGAAAWLYGRFTCPPPDWWLRLFVPSGDFACVQ